MVSYNVGICIPNYNMSTTLTSTILSAIKQTYADCTIYIVDNCSTDNSWDIIQAFQKKYTNIVSVQNMHHVSMEENWNITLRLAQQDDYVNILSADDMLEPTYVQQCIQIFKSTMTPLGYVYTERYNIIDGKRMDNPNFYKHTGIIDKTEAFKINIKGFHTAPCQLLINNQALKEVGYLSTKFGIASDMHMTLKLNSKYNVAYIKDKLVGYNISTGMSAIQQITKLLAILFYQLKNDIITHYLPKDLEKSRDELIESINIFCARYCLSGSLAAIKVKDYQEAKKLVLLACSFAPDISHSTLLKYILNNTEYTPTSLQKHITVLYPRKDLCQPYSMPKNSILMENACV